MENQVFIQALSQKNADYNNPEQAITTANLCDTISRDINTDSQRFIYELLQNADDASSEFNKLDVQINFIGNYVIISHKGEAFSKIDIESISSAGDGTKSGDSNKTGFKGIGFKSVFSHSDFVIIKSGNFCFKFDKQHWQNHWNNAWGIESDWKQNRVVKQKDDTLKMPWQIIPIWTDIPAEIKALTVFDEYNVSTIIKYDKIEKLRTTLTDLFSKSQIVLFLRSKEVKITINTTDILILEKQKVEGTTILKRNGIIISEWLIKTDQFDLPIDVQIEINADEKSPKKLKDAKRSEISFALQLENGKLKAVDKSDRLIFTYLPTSINYDFPFLVNAGFLTDAGRQHLHEDIFWNNWIFKQIPLKFFVWVAELASKTSKYNNQFLSIIPSKLSGYNGLEINFNDGYRQALENIAFIPNLQGELLKVSETIFDKTNISEFISKQIIINYINTKTKKLFNISSFVRNIEPTSTLSRLGTEMFEIEDLEGFFASEIFSNEHQLNENYKLISFLYDQVQLNKGDELRRVWNEKLKLTPFIFDGHQTLKAPQHIYFPAIEFSDEFNDEISVVNESVVIQINANHRIKNWLEYIGVKEPSDISFIEKTIIAQADTFITKNNALQLGRYLFNAQKKGLLQVEHYRALNKFKLLTKKGNLILAKDAYLSDFYEPDLRIETVYENDFYVSENYFESKDLKSEWKTFMIKIGVKNQLSWEEKYIEKKDCILRRDYSYFEPIIKLMDGDSQYSNYGSYSYGITGFTVHHFSFVDYVDNYEFSLIFWNNVFKLSFNLNSYDEINGYSGFFNKTHYVKNVSTFINYFPWSIKNLSLFPTTNKDCKRAADIFINSPEIVEIAGKHLPVLDYTDVLTDEWLNILPFKKSLDLDDYLKILSAISKDDNTDEALQKENLKRIETIYEKLANNYLAYVDKLSVWGKSNKLLIQNGKSFEYPDKLQLVTVKGFNNSTLAFADENNIKIVELLRIFGVTIIDKVIPTISNSKVEINDLKEKLKQISPLIALVAVEKSRNRKEWESEFDRIRYKLSTIHFYETSEIYLSYGNEEDKQKRSSWADGDDFYYVGNWYSPRILDGLVEPLGRFLSIRYVERILTVLLLETFAGGIEYLKEKGYDDSLIPDELLNPIEPETTLINQSNRAYNQSDEDLGKKGEKFVYEELKRIYTKKYGKPFEETSTGFKIGNELEVIWRNISNNTSENHDFKVLEMGKEIYIESKATPYNKNIEKIALYISGNELSLMEAAEQYLLARVFNVTTEPEMELIKMQMGELNN